MRSSFIIYFSLILCGSIVSGQTIPADNIENKYEVVMIHKQFGDTISRNELYNYLQYDFEIYTYKISGDTIYKYVDEDPPEKRYAFIDSISNVTLKSPANLDSIQDITGAIYTKVDLENKVIVLNFWATWCGICIQELPELNKLVEHYIDKEVLFFAPTLESSQMLDEFLSRREFKYKVVSRADKIAGRFLIFALPSHVIINRDGIVNFIQIGADTETIYKILAEEIEKCF